ncbi:MAG: hypothetical protein AB2693_11335 [Candidatus Thiodiazotropha sp.]
MAPTSHRDPRVLTLSALNPSIEISKFAPTPFVPPQRAVLWNYLIALLSTGAPA